MRRMSLLSLVVAVLACGTPESTPVDAGTSDGGSQVTCTPGALVCDDGTLSVCNENGVEYAVVQVCALGCATNGQPTCNEPCPANVRRCTAEGMLESCDEHGRWTAQSCEEGVCVQAEGGANEGARCVVCEHQVGVLRCEGADLVRTNASCGVDLVQACSIGCEVADGTPRCVTCEARTKRCVDDTTIETCASDGLSWAPTACDEAICRFVPSVGAECVQCTQEGRLCRDGKIYEANTDCTETLIETCEHGCGEGPTCAP